MIRAYLLCMPALRLRIKRFCGHTATEHGGDVQIKTQHCTLLAERATSTCYFQFKSSSSISMFRHPRYHHSNVKLVHITVRRSGQVLHLLFFPLSLF